MSLPIPFVLYGTVTRLKSGDSAYNATVEVHDLTNPQGTLTTTTDGTGKYICNLRNYVSIGDTIEVDIDFRTHTTSDTFTLTLVPPSEKLDFIVNDSLTITYDSTNVYLTMPNGLVESTTKSIQNLVFNNGNDVQLDRGKTGDSLTLSGIEPEDSDDNMETLNNFMDDKRIVTVSELPDNNLNTEYHISNLDFTQNGGEINTYTYNITLERVYDRL